MNVWVLFIIILDATRYYAQPDSYYLAMEKCFEARDMFMEIAPYPKINYEAVCIQTDRMQMR